MGGQVVRNDAEGSVKRFLLAIAIAGLVLPLLIFALSEAGVITTIWWFNSIPFVWPTYFMMLPFSGALDAATVGMLLLSAIANAIIYTVAAAIVFLVFRRSKRASHAPQGNG
jgi:hypothetical protein